MPCLEGHFLVLLSQSCLFAAKPAVAFSGERSIGRGWLIHSWAIRFPAGHDAWGLWTRAFDQRELRIDRRSVAYHQPIGLPLVSLHEFNHKSAGYARHGLDYPR